jgi:hypothetical protein
MFASITMPGDSARNELRIRRRASMMGALSAARPQSLFDPAHSTGRASRYAPRGLDLEMFLPTTACRHDATLARWRNWNDVHHAE